MGISGDFIMPGDVYEYRCGNDQGYGYMIPVKTSNGCDFIDTYQLDNPWLQDGETKDEASIRRIIELGNSEHDGLQIVGRLVGTSVGENIIERLANLIDRPTCKDVGRGYTFECSECGCRIGVILRDSYEGEPAMTVHDDPLYVPRYCPNCGAEVVE